MELSLATNLVRSCKALLSLEGYKFTNAYDSLGISLAMGKISASDLITQIYANNGVISYTKAVESKKAKLVPLFLLTRMLENLIYPLTGKIDSVRMSNIYKSLVQDFAPRSSALRKSNLAQNGSSFTEFKLIPKSLATILSKLNAQKIDSSTTKSDFASILSHYMRELIILAPLQQFSNLIVKFFLLQFALRNNFTIDYFTIPLATITASDNLALATDNVEGIFAYLNKITHYFTSAMAKGYFPAVSSSPQLAKKSARRKAPTANTVVEIAPEHFTVVPDDTLAPNNADTSTNSVDDKAEILTALHSLKSYVADITKELDTLIAKLQ